MIELIRRLSAKPYASHVAAFWQMDHFKIAGPMMWTGEQFEGNATAFVLVDMGILITDHNVRETLGICDRAYIVNEGTVLDEGTPQAIAASDKARKFYLGEGFKF